VGRGAATLVGLGTLAIAVLVGAGCGGGAGDPSAPDATTATTTFPAAMSTTEQTVETGPISLSIPTGAIPADIEVTLSEVALPEHLELFAIPGTAITAEPPGLTFAEPATITWRLPLDEIEEGGASIPVLFPVVVGGEVDEFLDNVVLRAEDGELVISAELTHFSTIYVAGLAEVEDCSMLFSLPAVRVVGVGETFEVLLFGPEGSNPACRLTQLKWGQTDPLTQLRERLTLVQEYLCTAEGNGTYTMDFDLAPTRTVAIDIDRLPPRQMVLLNARGEPVRSPREAKPPPQRTSVHFQVVGFAVCVPPPSPPIDVSMVTGTAGPGNVWTVTPTETRHDGSNDQPGVDFVVLFRPGPSDEAITAWISFWDVGEGAAELYQQSADPRHGGCGRADHPESEFLPGPVSDPVVGPDGHLWCRAFFRPDEQATLYRYRGEVTSEGSLISDWSVAIEGETASQTTLEHTEGRWWLDVNGMQVEVPPEVYDDLSP
jgi:hypothetical protein